jgi:Kef-type K+ transport system membrane component KefB
MRGFAYGVFCSLAGRFERVTSVGKRRTRVLLWTLAVVFGVLALGGLVGVVWWWGVGFDEAEALGVATRSTDAAMVASFWTAVTGFAGLLVRGLCVAFLHGRTRS